MEMPAGSADGLITHYMTYLFDAGGERRWAAPRREEERRVLAALDAAVDRVAKRNLRGVHARPYATTHGQENERSHPPKHANEPTRRARDADTTWLVRRRRTVSTPLTSMHTHAHTHTKRSIVASQFWGPDAIRFGDVMIEKVVVGDDQKGGGVECRSWL